MSTNRHGLFTQQVFPLHGAGPRTYTCSTKRHDVKCTAVSSGAFRRVLTVLYIDLWQRVLFFTPTNFYNFQRIYSSRLRSNVIWRCMCTYIICLYYTIRTKQHNGTAAVDETPRHEKWGYVKDVWSKRGSTGKWGLNNGFERPPPPKQQQQWLCEDEGKIYLD